MALPWYWYPQIDLRKFHKLDWFPRKPSDFAAVERICIGTKSKTIGDALVLSGLPRALKAQYPKLEITCYPIGFNPSVFFLNPYVHGVDYWPSAVFGDDCNEGRGHLIQLKEQFFGLEPSRDPKPELYLSPVETEWAQEYIERNISDTPLGRIKAKPLCLIHPWGNTQSNVASLDLWEKIVPVLKERFTVWQIGAEGSPRIMAADRVEFSPKIFRRSRQLFALMSEASVFVGVDSGPMHVAKAFRKPSLILDREDTEEIFTHRKNYPFFLKQNYRRVCLYESNVHIQVTTLSPEEICQRVRRWMEKLT